MVNLSQPAPQSIAFAVLLQGQDGRSRYPFCPCYRYAFPTLRTGRRPLRGRRVRSQTTTANPESSPAARTESPGNRSFRRRFVLPVHTACPLDPNCDHAETLVKRRHRILFSPKRKRKPGPRGPSRELIDAIVDTKQRNPSWGCPRIAQQACLAFGVSIDRQGHCAARLG